MKRYVILLHLLVVFNVNQHNCGSSLLVKKKIRTEKKENQKLKGKRKAGGKKTKRNQHRERKEAKTRETRSEKKGKEETRERKKKQKPKK